MIGNLNFPATKWLPEERLPRDLQHEAAIIAGLILREDRDRWLSQLTADDFFDPLHQQILKALKCLPPGGDLLHHLYNQVNTPGQSTYHAIARLIFRNGNSHWFEAQPCQLDRYIGVVKYVSHSRRWLLKCQEDLAAAYHQAARYLR